MSVTRAALLTAGFIAAAPALPQASPADAGPNPFARAQPAADGTPFIVSASDPTFVLRATMKAGDASLVNVDGQILRIGDEIGGYRLESVGEGTAVFTRGQIPYVLTIAEQEAANE